MSKKTLSSLVSTHVFNIAIIPLLLFSSPTPSTAKVQASTLPSYTDTIVTVLPKPGPCIPTGQCGTPMDIAWTPDGRILIPEKDGHLYIYSRGSLSLALDISSETCYDDDRSLSSVAIHPNFPANHYIYLWYTYKKYGTCNIGQADDPVNRLSRFILADNNTINPASETPLLDTAPQPSGDHNDGDLKFGPDGNLYIATGEGGNTCCSTSLVGSPTAAEDPGTLVGKILRITGDGSIPSGNPFNGTDSARCNLNGLTPQGSGASRCQEVYAVGLRNPFRFALDPNSPSPLFYINDVGENTWEEVDQLQAAADYGWPQREGPCSAIAPTTDCGPPKPGLTNPVYWYKHQNTTLQGNSCVAITGAAFVPDHLFNNSLDRTFLYADYICGGIWSLSPDTNAPSGYGSTLIATVQPDGLVTMSFGPYNNTQSLYYTRQVNYGTSPGELHRISFSGTVDNTALTRNFDLDWADYDNSGKVDISDLSKAGACFGTPSTFSRWSQCSYLDLAERGRIDIDALVRIASKFGSTTSLALHLQPGTMDPSWRSQCALLPLPEQFYCTNLPP